MNVVVIELAHEVGSSQTHGPGHQGRSRYSLARNANEIPSLSFMAFGAK